jgi:hypothetical protein
MIVEVPLYRRKGSMAWMPAYVAVRNLLSMISMETTQLTVEDISDSASLNSIEAQ